RRLEYDTEMPRLDKVLQNPRQTRENGLMEQRRRGRQEELPIDDLVAPVLGEEDVILVGDLQRRRKRHSRILSLPIGLCVSIVARAAHFQFALSWNTANDTRS